MACIVSDVCFSKRPEAQHNMLKLTGMGCRIKILSAFTLCEAGLDLASIDIGGLVIMSNVCCPTEYKQILRADKVDHSLGPYSALVWGAIRAVLPNVAFLTLCRETDLNTVGEINKEVVKSRSWAITAPMHELPFEWRPKRCNQQDEDQSDELTIGDAKQVAILSCDPPVLFGTTFSDGKIDIVGAVVHAFRCDKTVLLIGEYDCALSLGIMMHVEEEFQEAAGFRMIADPTDREEDANDNAPQCQVRRWKNSKEGWTYRQYLAHVVHERPYNSIYHQGLWAACLWQRAQPRSVDRI